MLECRIEQLWSGESAEPDECVLIGAELQADRLVVTLDAPYHADPVPSVPPGRCEALWEFEVVEFFLVDTQGCYLELEVGPHGHWLAYVLDAPRRVVDPDREVELTRRLDGERWQARASVPTRGLALPPKRWNAFAIHGTGAARRYLAASPLSGVSPDFHQPDRFPEWP